MRHLISNCVVCRRLRGTTDKQKMADLREERITSAPPFTYCGVDLFGPFQIKQGRIEGERYGVLFACSASRAVHIETGDSLETDSFMNALLRFIARRGPVCEIRSDQGTNIVGAQTELKQPWRRRTIMTSRDPLARTSILIGLLNGKESPRCVSYGWRLGTPDTVCSIHFIRTDART